jgi:molybdate transport system regulatory protein
VSVRKWPVDLEVTLQVSAEHRIYAVVTNETTADLDLRPGVR